eukprot:CAMPEP_0177357788 /NCGR_PEP_ID=MMETSP0368-20130122/35246_1 /TAXON_ID=447022 ORGANISM="Scrippsiella hangoei-like, Strain SHHI-4" /NCGR_SAMPLE_ID=MMETSP0368 /ASSEMBLY_ACC=CAM_ASM_000363 /LENGTH=444 /DNA_ID=CAMNT_0018820211 /DNA_START=123 /DNA_END=1455 /DNA_ORIENTATION=-
MGAGTCEDPTCGFAHNQFELRKIRIARAQAEKDRSSQNGFVRADSKLSAAPGLSSSAASFSRQTTKASDSDLFSSIGSDSEGPEFGRQLSGLTTGSIRELSELGEQAGPACGRQWSAMSAGDAVECLNGGCGPEWGRQASAMTISEAFERVPGADDELPSGLPQRAVRNKFHKTKLCNFFQNGRCTKHRSCNFAHAREELSDLPDLRQTKLCPAVLEGGECAFPDCNFAHSPSEVRAPMRPLRPWQSKPDGDTLESDPAPTEASPIDARIKAWKRQYSLAGQAQNVQVDGPRGQLPLLLAFDLCLVPRRNQAHAECRVTVAPPGTERPAAPGSPAPAVGAHARVLIAGRELAAAGGRLRRGGGESGGCGAGLWRKEHFAMTSRKVLLQCPKSDGIIRSVGEDRATWCYTAFEPRMRPRSLNGSPRRVSEVRFGRGCHTEVRLES